MNERDQKLRQAFGLFNKAYGRKEHTGDFEAWSAFLDGFEMRVISAAVFRAPEVYPEWPPKVGQFVGLCNQVVEDRLAEKRSELPPMKPEPMRVTKIPDEYEQLAQKWERETIAAGRSPGEITPRSVAGARGGEIAELKASGETAPIDSEW